MVKVFKKTVQKTELENQKKVTPPGTPEYQSIELQIQEIKDEIAVTFLGVADAFDDSGHVIGLTLEECKELLEIYNKRLYFMRMK